MRALVKSQLRFARRHPVGALASLIGVALAVMAVVTVHVVSQSIRGVLDGAPISPIGHSHVLTAPNLTEENYFELRARWRRGDLPDVQAMAPVIDDFIDFGDQPYRIVGFDPLAGAAGYAGAAASAGAPEARTGASAFLTDDVLIASPGIADAIRLAGVPVTVLDAPRAGTTGTVGPEVLVADLPTAQRLLDREGQLDAIWLRVATARSRLLVALDGLLPGITAALPRYADPTIHGYHIVAVRRWNPASRFADSLAFTLGALALLSMLMAALVAAQASFSNAARRRLEHERLMVIGVSRRFLNWLGIAEGLVLGMVATVAGIALGIAISDWLLDTAFGADNSVQLDAWIVAKAAVCGLAVSAAGAAFAHRQPRDLGRSRHVAGLLGSGLAAYGLVNPSLLSAFAGLVGLCALQMAFGVPLAGKRGGKLAAMAKSIGARGNLRAAAARVGELRLALGALSVAVATAVGMGLMVESLRQDFTTMLDQRLWPGIYVSVEQALTADDEDWVRTQPGVQAVRRYGDLDFRLARGPARLSLAELDRPETARYEFNGVLAELAMVNEVGARLYDLAVGDTVTVTGRSTTLEVEIGHVFRDFGAPTPRVILPMAFESSLPVDAVRWRRFAVLADAGALPWLTAALVRAVRPRQRAQPKRHPRHRHGRLRPHVLGQPLADQCRLGRRRDRTVRCLDSAAGKPGARVQTVVRDRLQPRRDLAPRGRANVDPRRGSGRFRGTARHRHRMGPVPDHPAIGIRLVDQLGPTPAVDRRAGLARHCRSRGRRRRPGVPIILRTATQDRPCRVSNPWFQPGGRIRLPARCHKATGTPPAPSDQAEALCVGTGYRVRRDPSHRR